MKLSIAVFLLLHLLGFIKADKNCIQYSYGNEVEYQCTPKTHNNENNMLLLTMKLMLRQVTIQCPQNYTNFIDILPEINRVDTDQLDRVILKYCPLPSTDYMSVVRALNLTNVKALTISGTAREAGVPIEIKSDLFKGLDSVTYFQFTDNEEVIIVDNFIKEFTNVKYINLYNNAFKNLDRLNFSVIAELKELSINKVGLQNIYPGWFAGLKGLIRLHLFNNNIKMINQSTFDGLENLQLLELSNNKIEHIDNYTFASLTNLVNMSLLRNNVKYISKDMFKNNKNLFQIRLGSNLDLELEDYAFANLPALKIVQLSGCKLQALPKNVFSGSTNISELNLSNNQLKWLPDLVFNGLDLVTLLDLSYNNLTSLSDIVLEPLLNLKHLKLGNNQLTHVGTYWLKNQNKLEGLYLQHNNINNVSDAAMQNLTELVELDLSYNNIKFTSDGRLILSPFSNLKQLRTVNYRHNDLEDWNSYYMPQSLHLAYVDVSHNNIKSLSLFNISNNVFGDLEINFSNNKIKNIDTFFPVSDTNISIKVNIDNNPISCDCFNYGLISHLQKRLKNTFEILHYDELTCSSPPEFKHFKLTEIKQQFISCSIQDIWADKSTCYENCGCFWKPFNKAFVMDCSYKNLTNIPHFTSPTKVTVPYYFTNSLVESIEIYVDHNNLTQGPTEKDGYENVSTLVLSHNRINNIDFIPKNLRVLHLDHNHLSKLTPETLNNLNSSLISNLTLSSNPWICDCLTTNFKDYLWHRKDQVDSFKVMCKDTTQMIMLNANLCQSKQIILITVFSILAAIVLISAILVALFYKYQMEVKIWLYSKNLCLWFVTEEELDKDKIYDVFISFSHKEDEFVLKTMLPILESAPNPYKVCIHYRDWIPGESINNQVANSVNNSRRTLVVLSNNFIESCWSKMEFRMAHTQAIKEGRARVIVVILGEIDESKLDEELKAYLRTNTYIKWGDPWFWQRLTYALPHHKESKFNQKHANIMLKIDKKMDIIPMNQPQSTPPILSLDAKLLSSYPYSTQQILESPTADLEGPLIINTIK